MSKKIFTVFTASVLSCSFAQFAFANNQPTTESNNGVYLALQGAYSLQSNSGSLYYGTSSQNTSGFGARASIGYDINKYFSIEGGYAHLFNSNHYSNEILDTFLKIRAPIKDNFNIYMKVGADYMFNFKSFSGGDFGPAFGVGATYDFTPNWAADVSWTRYTTQDHSLQPNTDFIGVGLKYKFNL